MKPFLEIVNGEPTGRSYQYYHLSLSGKPSYWHFHAEFELTYIVEGHGIRAVGDHLGHLKCGDLMLLGENLPHDFNITDDGSDVILMTVRFPKSIIQGFPELEKIGGMLKAAKFGTLFSDVDVATVEKLMSFKRLSHSQRLITLLDVLNDLSEIPEDALESLSSVEFSDDMLGEKTHSRLRDVIEFVNNNIRRPIELKEVAEFTCMTVPSFCRWFKRSLGCSFVTYLNRRRIEEACRMLLVTELPVSEVASSCGFESFSNFNRCFSKHKHMTPSEYRKQTTPA
ncbi:AraC family transcriptional regulator [Pseudomaricurvus alkylphenolicus]|uniref:helix-turn-helix domain-containing protein n=1 Tax=Pseudomaricurvus alkylphenolicus TaxID=1306991 RepID=UPI00141E377A|nr:AraC family transcriptional regulator [Pseudomaricurvus alkylphenolicus]NIB38239.1 AraC family transcriptional regulator [Pseudomaricurvus alkylphenolicus]